MMKKSLLSILVFSTLVFVSACGNGNDNTDGNNDANNDNTPTEQANDSGNNGNAATDQEQIPVLSKCLVYLTIYNPSNPVHIL